MASIIGYIPGLTNLIWNPSFETNASDWSPQSGTQARVSTWDWVGSWSLELTANVAGTPNVFYATSGTHRAIVTPGKQYSYRAMVMTPNTNKYIAIRAYWYNLANGTISTFLSPYVALTANVPFLATFEGLEAPALAEHTTVQFVFGTGPTPGTSLGTIGDKFYVDGVQIVESDVDVSYIDGDQGVGYAWTGTAHASTSTRAAKPIYGASGRNGQILLSSELYKADKSNNIGEDITASILSGAVEMRTDRDLKFQFKGTALGANKILAYSDYIAPFMRLTYPDGTEIFEQIGLYSIAPPGEEWNEEFVTSTFQGYDLAWNLQESSFGVPFTVNAGTNVVQSMRDILNNEGLTRWFIPDNAATFTTARTWDTDKSKLAILNDHAEAIGYYTPHTDRIGYLRSYPYNNLDNTEPSVLLFSGTGSTVTGTIVRERLPDGIINMIRVMKEGAADGTISYTQTNANQLSRVSTVSLGRIRFAEKKVKDLVSLAVAKEIARETLANAASVYTRYQIKTIPDPRRNPFEIYDTLIYQTDGSEVISGKVRCIGWDIGFTPQAAEMTHYCNRIEPYE